MLVLPVRSQIKVEGWRRRELRTACFSGTAKKKWEEQVSNEELKTTTQKQLKIERKGLLKLFEEMIYYTYYYFYYYLPICLPKDKSKAWEARNCYLHKKKQLVPAQGHLLLSYLLIPSSNSIYIAWPHTTFHKGNPLLITFVQEVLLRCWFHETSYLTKHLWQLHILTSKNTLLRTCHFFFLKKKIMSSSLEDEILIAPFIF